MSTRAPTHAERGRHTDVGDGQGSGVAREGELEACGSGARPVPACVRLREAHAHIAVQRGHSTRDARERAGLGLHEHCRIPW